MTLSKLNNLAKPANSKPSIAFADLAQQRKRLEPAISQAIERVLNHGKFIMGPEVKQLESTLAEFCGVKHAISCSSGTDALLMVLMAKNITPNDAVFVPGFTFTATPEVVSLLGAEPVFVDVLPDTFNISPESLEDAIAQAQKKGLNPKAIIPVDLFGQPANYDAITSIANKHNLWVLSDAAQSFGASYNQIKVGNHGLATATSFFPAKPLGCYGDGGCVFTNDDQLANILTSIRVHGKGTDKYDNIRIGLNARLDTIQAAILLEKLTIYPEEMELRNQKANYYSMQLADFVQTPHILSNTSSAWAQYTIVCNQKIDRDHLISKLKEQNIPTAIYYPKPLHQQTAYKHYTSASSMEVSEQLAQQVLSLPMHPYLLEQEQDHIIATIKASTAS